MALYFNSYPWSENNNCPYIKGIKVLKLVLSTGTTVTDASKHDRSLALCACTFWSVQTQDCVVFLNILLSPQPFLVSMSSWGFLIEQYQWGWPPVQTSNRSFLSQRCISEEKIMRFPCCPGIRVYTASPGSLTAFLQPQVMGLCIWWPWRDLTS